MSAPVFFATIGLFFAAVLIVFGMKYVSAAYQARARLQSDDAYRTLAQKTATTQAETATALSGLHGDLSQIDVRLALVEKMLREVG